MAWVTTAPFAVAFAAWLALTVINQVKAEAIPMSVRRIDVGALIPLWTFFAPRPGVTDRVLVLRDRLDDGEVTTWRRLEAGPPNRFRGIWHPSKRCDKLISDTVASLLSSTYRSNDLYLVSVPYLLLLNLVERAPHDFRAVATQFAIVGVDRFHDEPEGRALFASAFVDLPVAP